MFNNNNNNNLSEHLKTETAEIFIVVNIVHNNIDHSLL